MRVRKFISSIARKIRGAFSDTLVVFVPRQQRISPGRTSHEYPRLPYGTDQTIAIAPPVAILLHESNAISYDVRLQRWDGTNWITIQQFFDHPLPIVLFDQANTPGLYRWSYKPFRNRLLKRHTWSSWIEFEITNDTPICQARTWSEIVADFSTRNRPVLLTQGDDIVSLRNRVNGRTPNSPLDHLFFDATRLIKLFLTGSENGTYDLIEFLGSPSENYNLTAMTSIGHAAMMAWIAAVENNVVLSERAWQWGYYWLNEHHKYLNNQPNRFGSTWTDSYTQAYSSDYLGTWWDYIQATDYSIPQQEYGIAIQRIFDFWNWRINQPTSSWFKRDGSFELRIAMPFESHQMRHWASMLTLGLSILKNNPPETIKTQIEAVYYRLYGLMPVWSSDPHTGEIIKGYNEGFDYLTVYLTIVGRMSWLIEKAIGNTGFVANRRINNSLEHFLLFSNEPHLGLGDRNVWRRFTHFSSRPSVLYYTLLPLMYASVYSPVRRLAYLLRGKIQWLASNGGVQKAVRDPNVISIGYLFPDHYDMPFVCLNILMSAFSSNIAIPQDWAAEPDNTYTYDETNIPKSAHVPALGVIAKNYSLNANNGVRVDLRASPFHLTSHASKDSPLSIIIQAYGNRFVENGAYRRDGVDKPFHDQYELTAASASGLWVGVHQSGIFVPVKDTFRMRGSTVHEILPPSSSKFFEGSWNGYYYVYFEGDATEAFVHLDAEMHHAKRRCVLLDFSTPIVVILDEVRPKLSNRGMITNWHTRFAPIQHSSSRYTLIGSIFWWYETLAYRDDLSTSESNWNGNWYDHLRPTVKAAARFGILREPTINTYSFVARGFGNDPTDVQTVPSSWSTNPYIVWNDNNTPRGVNYNARPEEAPPSYLRHLVVYSDPLPTAQISRFGYAIVPFRLRDAHTNATIPTAFADNEWVFARSDDQNPAEVQIGVFNNAPSAKYGVIVKFKKTGYTESNAVSLAYVPDQAAWNSFLSQSSNP